MRNDRGVNDDQPESATPEPPAEAVPSLKEVDDQVARLADDLMEDSSNDQIAQFWAVANRYAHIGEFDAFMGTPWGEAVPPPAWSFGDSPEMADRLANLVLTGDKTATTGLEEEYADADEPLPKQGDLSILLDGAGQPRALIRNLKVEVIPFGEVTAAQAAAEGEGDRTLESWRDGHRDFWSRAGYEIDDDSTVVWENFQVVYSVEQKGA